MSTDLHVSNADTRKTQTKQISQLLFQSVATNDVSARVHQLWFEFFHCIYKSGVAEMQAYYPWFLLSFHTPFPSTNQAGTRTQSADKSLDPSKISSVFISSYSGPALFCSKTLYRLRKFADPKLAPLAVGKTSETVKRESASVKKRACYLSLTFYHRQISHKMHPRLQDSVTTPGSAYSTATRHQPEL